MPVVLACRVLRTAAQLTSSAPTHMLLYADSGPSVSKYTPGLVVFIEKIPGSPELVCHGLRSVMIPLTMYSEFSKFRPTWTTTTDSSDSWLKANVSLQSTALQIDGDVYSRHVLCADYTPLPTTSQKRGGTMVFADTDLAGVFSEIGKSTFRLYLELYGVKNGPKCWLSHLESFGKGETQRLSELRFCTITDSTIHSERTTSKKDSNPDKEDQENET